MHAQICIHGNACIHAHKYAGAYTHMYMYAHIYTKPDPILLAPHMEKTQAIRFPKRKEQQANWRLTQPARMNFAMLSQEPCYPMCCCWTHVPPTEATPQ